MVMPGSSLIPAFVSAISNQLLGTFSHVAIPWQLCRCAYRAKVTESWRASEMSHLLKRVEQADLVQYGLIPEFVGRFPVICSLQVCLASKFCPLSSLQSTGTDNIPKRNAGVVNVTA